MSVFVKREVNLHSYPQQKTVALPRIIQYWRMSYYLIKHIPHFWSLSLKRWWTFQSFPEFCQRSSNSSSNNRQNSRKLWKVLHRLGVTFQKWWDTEIAGVYPLGIVAICNIFRAAIHILRDAINAAAYLLFHLPPLMTISLFPCTISWVVAAIQERKEGGKTTKSGGALG